MVKPSYATLQKTKTLKKLFSRDDAASTHGFTIVELIIVTLVIAILALITMIAFNGVQNKTHEAAVMSNLRDIAERADLYKSSKRYYPGGNGVNSASTADFMNLLVGSTAPSGLYTFASKSYGTFFSATKKNIMVLLVLDASSNVTDYCLATVAQSGQAFWVASPSEVPKKGPYGSPTNSLTASGILTQCSSLLGYSVSATTYIYTTYDVSVANPVFT